LEYRIKVRKQRIIIRRKRKMKLERLLISIVIVSLLVSMAFTMVSAKKPPKPPPEEPPVDPAIAFFKQTSGPNENQIVIMNEDGSNQAVIYEDYFSTTGISWSPDGNSIAWSGYTYVPNVPGQNYGIWRMDIEVIDNEPQGSNLQQLVSMEYSTKGAAWSPLGDEIAYASRTDPPSPETGGLSNKIFVVPASGEDYQVIYTGPDGTTGIRSPTWSSDGTRIAFGEDEMSTGEDYIKIIERETGDVTHILMKGLFTSYSSFGIIDWANQNSDILVFHSGGMIYTVDIDSGSPVEVVEGNGASWSPDNSKIVYVQPGRKPKISTYEFATGDITALVNGGTRPDWRR
jgi:WD40 repeat protein